MEVRRTSHQRASTARGRRLGRRATGSRGVALVEFALVAPVLFLVVFGIVEFGMGLNNYQSLRQGAREGARQAVVQQYGAEDGACTGVTAPADVKRVMCLTEERIALGDDVRTMVEYWVPEPPSETDETAAIVDYGTVTVCAQWALEPLTGAIPGLDNIHLKTSIEMRLEDTLAADVLDDVEAETDRTKSWSEPAPDGGDWAWCG